MAISVIFGFLFFALCVGGIVATIYLKKSKKKIYTIIGSVVFGLCLLFIPFSIHTVEAGEVAVVKNLGKIEKVEEPGTHFDFWLTKKTTKYDCKVQQVKVIAPTYSKDGQTLEVEVVIQYQIQKDNVKKIATVYGSLETLENRIESKSIERMKSVLSEKAAMEIIQTRNEISSAVTQKISEAINEEYYITITNVILTNIDFTNEFEKIIEEKVAAQQEAEKAKNEAEKAKTEAQAKLEVAKLEADAALYKAQQEAEAQLAKARADAEAQKVIAQAQADATKVKSIEVARMLGYDIRENTVTVGEGEDAEQVVEYEIVFDVANGKDGSDIAKYIEYIQYLETWNGILPTVMSDNGATILIPTT